MTTPIEDVPRVFHRVAGTFPSEKLPIGMEFDCIYAPESSTLDGWVIVRFKVGMFPSIHPGHEKDMVRGYAQTGKWPISETQAVELYEESKRPS